ncbi:LOW QUALITY PROTEIN: peptide ABC transporter, permease, partial [Streptomyces sp. SPB074]
MSFPVFLARRAASAAVLLVLVTGLVFAATSALPGDAVSAVAGADASPAERAAVRHSLGLDRPVAERYARWAGKAVRGDLGTGLVGHRPVAGVLADRLPASLLLAGLTLLLVVPCPVGLGLWAGLRRGRAPDRFVSFGALAVAKRPRSSSWRALLIAVFSTEARNCCPRVVLVPLGGSPLQGPERARAAGAHSRGGRTRDGHTPGAHGGRRGGPHRVRGGGAARRRARDAARAAARPAERAGPGGAGPRPDDERPRGRRGRGRERLRLPRRRPRAPARGGGAGCPHGARHRDGARRRRPARPPGGGRPRPAAGPGGKNPAV